MNEIITQDKPALPAVSTERTMIDLLAQMASNPNVDPDRLEKLLNTQITMLDRQAKADFDAALSRVQKRMPRITKRGEITNSSGKLVAKYFKYEDIDAVIRPILNDESMSMIHKSEIVDNRMVITTILKHGGHQESTTITLPFDKANAMKSEIQAMAGTASVGKRNNVCNLLNIVAEGEDDESVAAAHTKIDDSQAKEIKDALRESGGDVKQFLVYMKADCVEKIMMRDYGKACVALRRKVIVEAKKAAGV